MAAAADKRSKWTLEEWADHEVGPIEIDQIRPHPRNPHQGDVAFIAESIKTNDWYGTITVQKSTGYILAGEHRWRAARKLKKQEVAIYVRDVDPVEAVRILLVDNKSARRATYDPDKLAVAVGMVAEVDESLVGTGFDMDFLEKLEREREAAEQVEEEKRAAEEQDGLVPDGPDLVGGTAYAIVVSFENETEQEEAYEQLAGAYGEENLRVLSV